MAWGRILKVPLKVPVEKTLIEKVNAAVTGEEMTVQNDDKTNYIRIAAAIAFPAI